MASSAAAPSSAAGAAASTDSSSDPHAWLEDVLGEKPLAWVKEKNAACLASVGDPTKTPQCVLTHTCY
jgi:prolyl oligopeptidase